MAANLAVLKRGVTLPARLDTNGRLLRWGVKPVVFFACLGPAALMLWEAMAATLGANPVEALLHRTGDWTLRLLLVTLAVTPLRRWTGWSWPLRLRRMLGLFAFFYAVSHLVVYLWLDRQLAWGEIVVDIVERPYITVGFAAFVILSVLAATSPKVAVRRLGRRWQPLHRWIYPAAVLGVVHFWWLVKADVLEPLVYASILALLLAVRLYASRSRQSRGASGVS
jgi:sulfoxide reductase heme-binding subunit YedZ